MTLVIAAQLIGVGTSFVSVYYWWRSAQLQILETSTVAGSLPKGGGPGDQFAEVEGGTTIHWRFFEQSKLNAKAAAWTGVSTLLQSIAIIATICGAH